MEPTAGDVMTTDLVSVTPATPIAEFARICAEDGISGAPVVTVDGRLVGIVSKTDLLPRLLEGRMHAHAADLRGGEDLDDEFDAMAEMASESEEEVLGTVDEIMQGEVVTVEPSAPVSAVARRMAKERIHRVVVVEGDRIRGILTSLDLLARYPAGGAPKRTPAKRKAAKGRARNPAKRSASGRGKSRSRRRS